MTSMLDLMGTFHDIDRLKGRVCGRCEFYVPGSREERPPVCGRGELPFGRQDGCDEFSFDPGTARDAA